jgi:hypothetical protein
VAGSHLNAQARVSGSAAGHALGCRLGQRCRRFPALASRRWLPVNGNRAVVELPEVLVFQGTLGSVSRRRGPLAQGFGRIRVGFTLRRTCGLGRRLSRLQRLRSRRWRRLRLNWPPLRDAWIIDPVSDLRPQDFAGRRHRRHGHQGSADQRKAQGPPGIADVQGITHAQSPPPKVWAFTAHRDQSGAPKSALAGTVSCTLMEMH